MIFIYFFIVLYYKIVSLYVFKQYFCLFCTIFSPLFQKKKSDTSSSLRLYHSSFTEVF
ncbi:hypothetical protein CLONEX_04130 [[Clostridium] nexile DSM 1787]|nr:hypothetical protein CLONEX_04130 [[Clostridium] nexile DSM 1787]